MKAVLSLALLTCFLLTSLCHTDCSAKDSRLESRQVVEWQPGSVHGSSGTASSKAASDTFYLYGGPGTVEGRFQTALDGGAPDPQGWTSADLTERDPIWHASSVNSSGVGDGHPEGFTGGAGNHGVISHHDGPLYVGYGNTWNDWLVFDYDLSVLDSGFDPAADSTTVRLICEYKHDLEPGYDFLEFEWNQAESIQNLASVSGSSYNGATGRYEKRDFDTEFIYEPGDYIDGSSIQLRIRVTSDYGWSDEDGDFLTEGRGAAALDNIQVMVDGAVVSTADFEHLSEKDDLEEGGVEGHDNGADLGTAGWVPTPATFVGDFAKLIMGYPIGDPCRENTTPQWSFINDGTSPNNCPECPIDPAISSTFDWCGLPTCYVVDYLGGLSNGELSLANEIRSPIIEWDLPGSEDDGASAAIFGYSTWRHLPRYNHIYAYWRIRSKPVGGDWGAWKGAPFVYSLSQMVYGNLQHDVTDLLVENPEQVQIALAVLDLADVYGAPGDDATQGPTYDNVYFKKYVIPGPEITARDIDLANDCFPVDGTKTGSCRFDAALNIDNSALVPGDSIVATIRAGAPGSSLASPSTGGDLVVAHRVNPDFAEERASALAAVGGVLLTTDPTTHWEIYTYRIPGQAPLDPLGEPFEDRYFWDLPDGTSNGLPHIANEPALIFPGDVLHYHFYASDDLGNVTTLPDDLSAFVDFGPQSEWNRAFSMRALPTFFYDHQASILFWNDAGYGSSQEAYLEAFRLICLYEGVDFDVYTTRSPNSGVGNGLGSAGYHGATADQLDGYRTLIYALGDLRTPAISDGSGSNDNDLSNDLGVLEEWLAADDDRDHAYFGDNFAEAMVEQGAASEQFLWQSLAVSLESENVRGDIDDQLSPLVTQTGLGSAAFWGEFIADGGCPLLHDFDGIEALFPGVAAHEFTGPDGTPYGPSVAASVEWSHRDSNGMRKNSVTFPYDLSFVEVAPGSYPQAYGQRDLLYSVLASFGLWWGGCQTGVQDPTEPRVRHEFAVAQNHPNPFNPSTRIAFSLPQRGEIRITLYNPRGERVAVLLDELREAGPGYVDWNGTDARGAEVSSGVYFYKVEAAGREVVKKMALLR